MVGCAKLSLRTAKFRTLNAILIKGYRQIIPQQTKSKKEASARTEVPYLKTRIAQSQIEIGLIRHCKLEVLILFAYS